MPSDKFKFSAKNGVAPVIKRLYNSHKKLLGKNEKPKTNHKKENGIASSESSSKSVKNESKIKCSDTEDDKREDSSKHTYENVPFGQDGDGLIISDGFCEEIFANLSLSTIESSDYKSSNSGVSLIEITNEERKEIQNNVTVIEVGGEDRTDNKLKIVIDNFDKILTEYATPAQKRPQLQKSKTCSIIESKCILKKTFSEPSTDEKIFRNLKSNLSKTKSLYNLDAKNNRKKKLHECDFWNVPIDNFVKNVAKEDVSSHNVETPIKVKEVVKKINSLSGDETKNSKVANKRLVSNNKSNTFRKSNLALKMKKIEDDKNCLKLSMPRAVSCADMTILGKKAPPSRIPIKTNLNKTFPSTPNNLNRLDCVSRCAPRPSKTEIHKAVSMQNLSKNAPLKLKTVEKLKSSSNQNLQKIESKKFKGTNQVPKSKKTFEKTTLEKRINYNSRDVKVPNRDYVSRVVSLKEEISENFPKAAAADTFGVKKAVFEPKFCELNQQKSKRGCEMKKIALKRSDTYNKKDRVQEFLQLEKIERNLKTAKQFFIKTSLVSCDDLDEIFVKGEVAIECFDVLTKNQVLEPDVRYDGDFFDFVEKKGDDLQNVKDYASDDNSDDSGNISNELEIDDEPNATGSNHLFSSSESLVNSSKEFVVEEGSNEELENGKDEIFFRSGVLTQLESQRDERLAGMVVNLQAHCRGFISRKRLSQRKLQDLAVRCIQRNVRKFLLVRDWPWWRLLVRVTPLLNVHRTEEELKLKTEELEALKVKLEKLEAERTGLKHDNDKLEAKLSEMTADLAEEHSTSTLAAERLDAETSERVRLERELADSQQKNKDLRHSSERLEMELLYARSDLNGISEDDEDGDAEAVYKQRYERVVRELEFTKRRLQQQHEDDLEQLVGLKKQLEKKLTDAYEEVEEQRQVVGQWKRKVQKVNGEMNDLKLLLEEQNGRNNLLEKKQRKFDSEIQLLQDELKKEKQSKDRLGREKEVVIAEKYTLESNVADLRLELDLKEEKLSLLQREFDELTYGGKTEEEVTILRKQKIDCERRLHDQEEELDELAGQVQLLEQAKLKLEMSLEQQRKTAKKETQQHDEELEEVRCNAQKKVKALEAQLENEHDERTILLREKHELERRLTTALENDRSEKACDEAALHRLKRDLKRTKALLRDTQAQLERQKAENPSKALIRQLRNQIEDSECARSVAVKAKQTLEAELSETQAVLEETTRQKNDAEEKANVVSREKADLQTQVEENEEELAEVLKKYKTTIQQMSLDQIALQEQVAFVSELEAERNSLKEQLIELTSKLESVESMGDASSNLLIKRTELKVKELESKLDLEQTTRTRLEVQISRLKEAVEKLQNDLSASRTKEQQAQDQIRKLQRNLRELRDEHNSALTKESESALKRKELEKRYEALEAESSTVRTDLRLALKRIEDLQAVIQNELEDSTENSDSDRDSYSSDDSVNTFLVNHKMNSSKSSSMTFDNQRRLSNTSRSSTSSNLTKESSYA